METIFEIKPYGKHKAYLDISGADRVRKRTPVRINNRLDQDVSARVRELSRRSPTDLTNAIDTLEKEWDIDRAALVFFGTVLPATAFAAARINKKLYGLLALELVGLLGHAVIGFSLPTVILRQLGFRTREEIDAEKYVLKTLRGDFKS